jgi:hypothetical protein
MSTMKEHLAGMHKRMAAHHTVTAASHASRASHFNKLAAHLGKTEMTEAQKDSAAILEALAQLHEEQGQEHTAMASFHKDSAEKCSKAADGDLNKIVPDRVSAVTPDRPAIRPVLRHGQREIEMSVEPALEKVLGSNPADWDVEEPSLR